MTIGLIVENSGEISEISINKEKYKLCGYKNDNKFMCIEEWMHEIDDSIMIIQVWGKTSGTKKQRNDYFTNFTSEDIYGTCLLAANDTMGVPINLTNSVWTQFTDGRSNPIDGFDVNDFDEEDDKEEDDDSDEERIYHTDDEQDEELTDDQPHSTIQLISTTELQMEEYDY